MHVGDERRGKRERRSGVAASAAAGDGWPALPGEGIYVLLLRVPEARGVEAGALGRLDLRPGFYAYVGRARQGLTSRLARHARREGKRLRWHVDHLILAAEVEEIWVLPLEAGECETAARLAGGGAGREGLRGFGASDCRCPGHLLYLGTRKPLPLRDAVRFAPP